MLLDPLVSAGEKHRDGEAERLGADQVDDEIPISGRRGQERQARPLVVGCSTETGSDAGKVFLRASSWASS